METIYDTSADASATIKQETSVPIGVNLPKGFEEPRLDDSAQAEPEPDPLDQGAGAPPVTPKHSCYKSPSCKLIWGLLGCIELYKLTSSKKGAYTAG